MSLQFDGQAGVDATVSFPMGEWNTENDYSYQNDLIAESHQSPSRNFYRKLDVEQFRSGGHESRL
jgi:hypothetical protein